MAPNATLRVVSILLAVCLLVSPAIGQNEGVDEVAAGLAGLDLNTGDAHAGDTRHTIVSHTPGDATHSTGGARRLLYSGPCSVPAGATLVSNALNIPASFDDCMTAGNPTSDYANQANSGFLLLCVDYSFWGAPPNNGNLGYVCATEGHYQSVYSFQSRASLYTAYRVLPQERTPNAILETQAYKDGRPKKFQAIPDTVNSNDAEKSREADYGYSISKGHLAFNGLFKKYGNVPALPTTKKAVNKRAHETFMIANVAPQIAKFNNVVWGSMEEAVIEVLEALRLTNNLHAAYFATGAAYTEAALQYDITALEAKINADHPQDERAAALVTAKTLLAQAGAVVYELDVDNDQHGRPTSWRWDFGPTVKGLPWPEIFWTIALVEQQTPDGATRTGWGCAAIWGNNPYPSLTVDVANPTTLPDVEDESSIHLRIGTLEEFAAFLEAPTKLGPVRIPKWLEDRCQQHAQYNDDLRRDIRTKLQGSFTEVVGTAGSECKPTEIIVTAPDGSTTSTTTATTQGCDARYVVHVT